MADQALPVGLGEIKISNSPGDVLVAYGLGSCVGVGMYDPVAKVAGMLHAVLPQSLNGTEQVPGKFVTTGVPKLIEEMEKAGALRSRLQVRMAGGANMLTAPGAKQAFNIGERNVLQAHTTLDTLRMRLQAEDVGGTVGRTVRLFVNDGRMTVKALGSQEKALT
ncbi:MAG TPA: chemotaxis protein CheD [Anaerolineales bacterium]|nr:chemotaxis protein CheD [Anaerolineales bacterium]HRF47147.1 chemotaxis protein CheD [Anaerolineales bacterium]